MKHRIFLFVFAFLLLLVTLPAAAEEQFTYISQPEEVVIFLNDIAFVHDTLKLTGDSDAQIVLPNRIYQDTLVVRENGGRVPAYSVNYMDGQITLRILNPQEADLREITLEYLTSGLSWKPNYDMWLTGSEAESVQFVFYAEIRNDMFSLDGVDVTLAAGRVDTSRQLDAMSTVTTNQYIAGYEERDASSDSLAAGAVTIQHLYTLGELDSNPGDSLYMKVLDESLPARRLLLWNAQMDKQVTVIYKVRNESTLALAEGIVRSYQDGLFIGSDFIEFTPVGSEGSVTVGSLQDVRVNRAETQTHLDNAPIDADMLHEITLTMSNFSDSPVEIEVVDGWPPSASAFAFSDDPRRGENNLFRWSVVIPAGETQTITYEYRTP